MENGEYNVRCQVIRHGHIQAIREVIIIIVYIVIAAIREIILPIIGCHPVAAHTSAGDIFGPVKTLTIGTVNIGAYRPPLSICINGKGRIELCVKPKWQTTNRNKY